MEKIGIFFGNDNPQADLAEDVATAAADMQLQQTADTAKGLDSYYGSPAIANEYYRRNGGIGKGLLNEQAHQCPDSVPFISNEL